MPPVLTVVGSADMLWVGDQIILHGLGMHPAEWVGLHGGPTDWLAGAALSGVFGLILGGVIVGAHHLRVAARKG